MSGARPDATPRRAMTPARRRKIWEEHRGQCEECGKQVSLTEAEIDHVVPLWMGGADDDTNYQILDAACHRVKTVLDAANRAKVKRLQARQDGTRRERREINSAPFPNKNRKFDGSIGPVRARSPR